MFEFQIDAKEFEQKTVQMGAAFDQLPFALSVALNKAANDTYNHLIEDTWPHSVTVRNSQFIRWALHTEFSTKTDLCVTIYDKTPDQRAHLAMHDEGGTKVGKGMLAVPTSNVTLTSQGERKDQQPRNLHNKVVKGNLIYQKVGRGKHAKLKLMYVLVKSIRQPADVPFRQDFETVMRESMSRHFGPAMEHAMATRR